MGDLYSGFVDLMRKPVVAETLLDILLCAVPIWVAVMIGLVIGWSWRPRWTGLLFLGCRSKLRFLWTAPPGLGARRLWIAFTALSAFSVCRKLWSSWSLKGKGEPSQDKQLVSEENMMAVEADGSKSSFGLSLSEHDIVAEKDLEHMLHLLDGDVGDSCWNKQMERTTPNMIYQAWCHEPEVGPIIYRSRTVFEDASPEVVRDFFWDDDFRFKWDPMFACSTVLEEFHQSGTMITHWIKKFPFFCSDREYIIGRRIWEFGKAYYCVTKINGSALVMSPRNTMPATTPTAASLCLQQPVWPLCPAVSLIAAKSSHCFSFLLVSQPFLVACDSTIREDVVLEYGLARIPVEAISIKSTDICALPAVLRGLIVGPSSINSTAVQETDEEGVPYPSLPKNIKPRRVELYFSSWRIRAVESRKQDGQLSACEVTLVHYEDMGIPKDVAKVGVRHGMWGAVKKLQSGMRAYQAMRRTGTSLSKFALTAQITTKLPNDGTITPIDMEIPDTSEIANASESAKGHHGIDWKLVVIGGVAIVCGLQAGLVGKALLFGAARRLARK
ncbi:hypothetical protein ZIOFF_038414 [Zingiber officinale]|uniref:START domain-containing protein n=1 Tax=Zingiber officinale TaxID=94328 RepID=A0A8J5GEL1_ZINOF|nr:hypothetical protein ZIOFF_038414 [Zingiber officinale]